MWSRLRRFRWPALAAMMLLAVAWHLSHRGALWVAPQVAGRMPVLLFMGGIAQFRIDPLPSVASMAPPAAGFSASAPMGVFVYH